MEATNQARAIGGDEDGRSVVEALLRRHGIPLELAAELKDKHEDVWILNDAPVVFRRPKRAYVKMFGDKMRKDKGNMDAMEEFARHCIVHPEGPALDALLDKAWGITATVAAEAFGVAQGKDVDEGKKL